MGTLREEVTEMEMVNAQLHNSAAVAARPVAPLLLLAGLRVDVLRLLPIIIQN